MRAISHMTTTEKTTAILVLAEALRAATLVGDPAPLVARLGDWMHAPPRVGDLVVETSTGHRGPDPSRVGVVLRISRHQSAYERVTEILVLDPPCGSLAPRGPGSWITYADHSVPGASKGAALELAGLPQNSAFRGNSRARPPKSWRAA